MIRAYLKPKEIKEGMFSNENIIEVDDYDGKKQSGFFNKRCIKNGKLEVVVFNVLGDLACVKPRGGYFLEHDWGITVHSSNLNYIMGEFDSEKDVCNVSS